MDMMNQSNHAIFKLETKLESLRSKIFIQRVTLRVSSLFIWLFELNSFVQIGPILSIRSSIQKTA